MKLLTMNIMPLNYQTLHASIEWYFLHKASESCGDSGNINNAHDAKIIINSTYVLFKEMQTLIQTDVKLKLVSFDKSNFQVKEKLNNSKFGLDLQFYQKLFVILFAFSALLIFPESPQDSEALCKKHYSKAACIVW